MTDSYVIAADRQISILPPESPESLEGMTACSPGWSEAEPGVANPFPGKSPPEAADGKPFSLTSPALSSGSVHGSFHRNELRYMLSSDVERVSAQRHYGCVARRFLKYPHGFRVDVRTTLTKTPQGFFIPEGDASQRDDVDA